MRTKTRQILRCKNCDRPVKWIDTVTSGRVLVHADTEESLIWCYPDEGNHLNHKHAELGRS